MKESAIGRREFLKAAFIGAGALALGGAGVLASKSLKEQKTGSFPSAEAAEKEALRLIEEEGACRVIVRGGEIVHIESGRGTAPLLRLLANDAEKLEGATLVESVLGLAAAAAAFKGGVEKIIARTASEKAREFLARNAIPLVAETVVPRIMNRDLTGPCPLEASAEGLSSADDIIAAATKTLENFYV